MIDPITKTFYNTKCVSTESIARKKRENLFGAVPCPRPPGRRSGHRLWCTAGCPGGSNSASPVYRETRHTNAEQPVREYMTTALTTGLSGHLSILCADSLKVCGKTEKQNQHGVVDVKPVWYDRQQAHGAHNLQKREGDLLYTGLQVIHTQILIDIYKWVLSVKHVINGVNANPF